MFKKTMLGLMISLLAISLAACASPPSPPRGETVAPLTESQASEPPSAPSSTPAAPTASVAASPDQAAYPIVDTGQGQCYDSNGAAAACPGESDALFGQDAQYTGNAPRYTNNGDGTITDNVTGLVWQKSPDTNGDGAINVADKLTYDQAVAGASGLDLAGHTDWRLPTVKELYSLIMFDGVDPSGPEGNNTAGLIPFIDTAYFDFAYGDTSAGERIIDAQYSSSTKYVYTTMNGNDTMFGVNFADGRIKGYGLSLHGQAKTFFVIYVRGNTSYGVNDFVDDGDGTISDNATGLMWQQGDSTTDLDWEQALAYCENLTAGGYDDWRLPDVKELQSIVDYARSPDTTGSAAIDPLFSATAITNEAGQADHGFYWSSTTHANLRNGMGAAYVAFGRALGYMNGSWIDVHGAGAQRSNPKSGNADAYPTGHGPQGDAVRIYNYARCVRSGAQFVEGAGSGAGASVQPPANDLPSGDLPSGEQAPSGDSPPQEAINACSGLSVNAACQFTTPHGDVSGTCLTIAEQLACVPEGGPPSQ